jgi:NAD(P)-dependent dehydrogenase (short-subunit alcohol dehydrogenase family)
MAVSEEPQMRLDGQVVMITGASRGLGFALARAFAAAGAAVSGCARSEADLEQVRKELQREQLAFHPAPVDVTAEDEVERWVDDVKRSLGPPTTLINNASLLGPRVPLDHEHPHDWRRVLDVNLTGSFLTARAVIPLMRAQGCGSIIQLSSGAALAPRTDWGAYSISKIAADGLALNLAAELEGTGIRVNAVDPGAMRTTMRAEAYPEEDPESLPGPETRTDIFLWLASSAARGVTGQRFKAADWSLP